MFSDRPQQPPLGIDLGTTFTVAAYLDETGRPTMLVDSLGERLMPSAVAFDGDAVLVGREALRCSAILPNGYAEDVKCDMGRKFFHHELNGRLIPPEAISAFILERVKSNAEARLGPIRQAVITVPAFFDETRRKATQEAGRIAGLNVLDIINEPTAAAIAYGYLQKKGEHQPDRGANAETVLTYDLGGGTFDVTILEIRGDTFRTLATDGDVYLGGRDFDARLVEHAAGKFQACYGVDPRCDAADGDRLRREAREAKHTLSTRSQAVMICCHAGMRLQLDVSRSEFEMLTSDLLERTKTTTGSVLRQAGLEWDDIDRLLLVGGATRMPMVTRMLRGISGKEPDGSLPVDEVVAQGAAIYAGLLSADGRQTCRSPFQLVNVNSHSLGVVGIDTVTGQNVCTVLIPKNTPLPCKVVKHFQTFRENQSSVCIEVVEGESHRPEQCIALGQCVIRNLPRSLPKGSRVEVEYEYHADGRISVGVRIPELGTSATAEIEREQSADLEELAVWRSRLCGGEVAELDLAAAAAKPWAVEGTPPDKPEILKRLDDLYCLLAALALDQPLPPQLAEKKQKVVETGLETKCAQARLQQGEYAAKKKGGPTESYLATAKLMQARAALQHAETVERYALMDFGRACVDFGSVSQEMIPHLIEIRQLERLINQ